MKEYTLERGQVLSVPATDLMMVSAVGGSVWLTISDNVEDYVLGPGETHHTRTPGLVVLQALGDVCKVTLAIKKSLVKRSFWRLPPTKIIQRDFPLLRRRQTERC